MRPIAATNDFVVKFANVNGSGSASANELFARAVLRMGVPVATRNIFPSNIQGLPTWYEVRVSGEGWLGRRGGVDLVVLMNPQTWNKDIAEVESGGYMLYDSTKPLTGQKLRSDVTVLGVPFTQLANSMEGTIPRERQLLKNIVYVGALASLLGLDLKAIDELLVKQFKCHERHRTAPRLRLRREEPRRRVQAQDHAFR
jgi:2-oxoglutarate ferredoxin oxidoreductase subunit alpha